MIKRIVFVATVMLFSFSALAAGLPEDTSTLPRMPDEYRNQNKASRNPLGMSIYDAAETAAEEDIFGSVVVPLEESQRILKERGEKSKVDISGKGIAEK